MKPNPLPTPRDWEAEMAATELAEALDALCWLVSGNTDVDMNSPKAVTIHSLFCVLRRTAVVAARPYQ